MTRATVHTAEGVTIGAVTDSGAVWRIPLEGPRTPLDAAGWLRGEPRPVALSGEWAGGGLILTSHPVRSAGDPFAAFDEPLREEPDAVGGGWFGWLGFGLARVLEPVVPPPPPRPVPLPACDLAFHDHVVRCDRAGRWWFEALPTPEREALLRERLESWRARLAGPPPAGGPAASTGPLLPVAPGTAGHAAAVAEAVARIAAGDCSQVNLCLRLEGELGGADPLSLWLGAVRAADPAYAAFVGGADHHVLSLSPELFLRRRGATVVTRPIKGTGTDPVALAASEKDRAENVMIVDLMRNDLGRVARYGSVRVTGLCEVEPAAGVVHLVSTVEAELRSGVGDGALLRATFPPGSVTGAPKVQALRLIHALEATGREAYCGAVGMRTAAGLELNVAIRTLETSRGRLWLGAGGGIVADSDPLAETAEALAKARGIAGAAGLAVEATIDPPPPLPPITRLPRPDPSRGLIETTLAADRPAHLARLRASAAALGLEVSDDDVRVREPIRQSEPTLLVPIVLPGGLGRHKWADRDLIDALSGDGFTPLFVDLDGSVLEAGYAAVLALIDGVLVAPPLDGRILPSLSRATLEHQSRRLTLEDLSAAEAIVLTSALRGRHPGVLACKPAPPATTVVCEPLPEEEA